MNGMIRDNFMRGMAEDDFEKRFGSNLYRLYSEVIG